MYKNMSVFVLYIFQTEHSKCPVTRVQVYG